MGKGQVEMVPGLFRSGLLFGRRLAEHGFDAGDGTAELAETGGVLQLTASLLDAEIENLLLHAPAGLGKVFHRLFANFFDLHGSIGDEKLSVEGTADETAANTELGGGEAEGFLGEGFRNAGDFKKHVAGTNHGHPELRSAFTFTHPGFRRAGRYRLVRENANENFAFPFQVAGDRDPAGLDLVVLDPSALQRLETELSKGHGRPHLRIAFAAAAV
jgi:hypothetical protein